MEHPNVLFFAGTTLSIVCAALFWVRKSKAPSSQYLHQSSSSSVASSSLLVSNQKSLEEEEEPPETKKQKNYPGGKVVIYFGSQTGTAESFGQILVDEGQNLHGFATELVDLEDVGAFWNEKDEPKIVENHKCLQPQVAIYLMATYGEGEPTDNSTDFVDFLKERHHDLVDPQVFQNVQFTVFGLGNRQYEQYNAMGRLVHKKLGQFGASCIFEYGEGDDDGSLEEDFESWREQMWAQLKSTLVPATSSCEIVDSSAPHHQIAFTCDFDFDFDSRRHSAVGEEPSSSSSKKLKSLSESAIQHSTRHFFPQHYAEVPIVVHRELRQKPDDDHGHSTLHLELDISSHSTLTYATADNLAICPENDPDLVTRLATSQHYVLSSVFVLVPTTAATESVKFPFPSPCSVLDVLTRYLDLNHAPRRSTCRSLARFATCPIEHDRLTFLASKPGLEAYHSWVVTSHRTLVDVIEHFASLVIPFAELISLVPYLQPRIYTISSSALASPRRIHVTVSSVVVHHHPTEDQDQDQDSSQPQQQQQRIFRGLCTRFLSQNIIPPKVDKKSKSKSKSKTSSFDLAKGSFQGQKTPRAWPRCRVFVRASSFRLPPDLLTPMIMIGPGTGIAPMRAFCQERQFLRRREENVILGPAILYFGCQHAESDYIYRQELEGFVRDGTLDQLHVAFSRAQKEKVYVQHLMRAHAAELWHLLHHAQASVYVCGGTAMGQDVQQVLVANVVGEAGQRTRREAEAYVQSLQVQGRYVQELWA